MRNREGEDIDPMALQHFSPTLFLYDNYPGDIGISAPLFEHRAAVVAQAQQLVTACECLHGCPSCIGSDPGHGCAARILPEAGRVDSAVTAVERCVLSPDSHGDTLRRVYIDTETTRLSTGSATLAFLVGIAIVKEAEIELRQFLLTCFSAEAALLSEVSGTLAADDRTFKLEQILPVPGPHMLQHRPFPPIL